MRIGNVHVPFLSLLVPLVLGIILSYYWGQLSFWFLIIPIIVCAGYLLLSVNKFQERKLLSKSTFFILLFFAGYYIQQIQDDRNNANFIRDTDGIESVILKIKKKAGVSPKYVKYQCELKQFKRGKNWISGHAGVLVLVNKHIHKNLFVGDEIAIAENLRTIPKPRNPEEFDYKEYLFKNGVQYQMVCKKHAPLLIEKGNSVFTKVDKFRFRAIETFQERIDEAVAPIAMALVLGFKSDLTKETLRTYQNSGSMHVLAVSGLHVGIVFMLLSFFFKIRYLKNIPTWIQVLVTIAVLWSYVLLSGGSISVIRAAIMFSVVTMGGMIKRKTSTYNALAVAAFVTLLIYPLEIFQVGFQFSYLAVIGIVFFYPYINRWISSRYKLINWIWSFIAVAIAAQLAIGFLSAFYFHSFPLLFPLSNLVVIPIAGIQVGAGLFLILVSEWAFMAEWLGIVMTYTLKAQVYLLELLNSIPCALMENIYLSKIALVLFYILLVLLVAYILNRKTNFLLYSLILILFLLMENSIRQYQNAKTQEIVLFGAKDICLCYIAYGKAYFYLGESLNSKALEYFAVPYLRYKGVKRIVLCKKGKAYCNGEVMLHDNGVFRIRDNFYGPMEVCKQDVPYKVTCLATYKDLIDLEKVKNSNVEVLYIKSYWENKDDKVDLMQHSHTGWRSVYNFEKLKVY